MRRFLFLLMFLSVSWYVAAIPHGTSIDYGHYQIQAYINDDYSPNSYIIYYKDAGKAVMYYEYQYNTRVKTVYSEPKYSKHFDKFQAKCESQQMQKKVKYLFKLMRCKSKVY